MNNGNAEPVSLPFTEACERGLLSSLMKAPGQVHKQCASVLWPDAFYIPANRFIYEALEDWSYPDRPVDFLWLTETLRQRGHLTEVGGKEYLSSLVRFIDTPDNSQFYLDTVMDAYCARRVMLEYEDFKLKVLNPNSETSIVLTHFYDHVSAIGRLNQKRGSWMDSLTTGAVSSNALIALDPVPRIPVIDDWCCVADLGYIFAARGLGKTWLAMHLAHGVATKQKVGPWPVHRQLKVLYLDGEMPAAEIKRRDYALGVRTEALVYVNHEILFERTGKVMNLADPEFQEATLATCQAKGFEMLCMDNLSTLASGIDENKAIDWELIQPWLLRLRRARITVIFIHHAGRNNEMRGVSKREDPASWILRLDEPNDATERKGAHFISRFTKWRNAMRQPRTYEWIYSPGDNGETLVEVKEASSIEVFKRLIENGLDTCTMIAAEMNVTAGYVSQLACQAEKEGWLSKKGRKYLITN